MVQFNTTVVDCECEDAFLTQITRPVTSLEH